MNYLLRNVLNYDITYQKEFIEKQKEDLVNQNNIIYKLNEENIKQKEIIENLQKELFDCQNTIKNQKLNIESNNKIITSCEKDIFNYIKENLNFKKVIEKNSIIITEYKRIVDKYYTLYDLIIQKITYSYQVYKCSNSNSHLTMFNDYWYIFSYLLNMNYGNGGFEYNASRLVNDVDNNDKCFQKFIMTSPFYDTHFNNDGMGKFYKDVEENMIRVFKKNEEYIKPY